jgi:hypothetical protein
LLTCQPLSVRDYQHHASQRWVHHTLKAHDISAVLAFSEPMAQYVPQVTGKPMVRVMDLMSPAEAEVLRELARLGRLPGIQPGTGGVPAP